MQSILSIIGFLAFVIGLGNAITWLIIRKRPNRKPIGKYAGVAFGVFIAALVISMALPADNNSKQASDSSSSQSSKVTPTKSKTPITASYGELVKSDDFVGDVYQIQNAQVIQADQKDGKTALLAYINNDQEQLFLIRLDGTTPAVQGDVISVKGVLNKRTDYDTQAGGSNTVPTLDTDKVQVVSNSK